MGGGARNKVLDAKGVSHSAEGERSGYHTNQLTIESSVRTKVGQLCHGPKKETGMGGGHHRRKEGKKARSTVVSTAQDHKI